MKKVIQSKWFGAIICLLLTAAIMLVETAAEAWILSLVATIFVGLLIEVLLYVTRTRKINWANIIFYVIASAIGIVIFTLI